MSDDEQLSWWAVVVRLARELEGNTENAFEEYSLRIIRAASLEEAKDKACLFAEKSNPDYQSSDGKRCHTKVISVVGAEVLGEDAPKDGDEIWSKLAFLDREEDQSFEGDSPPFWALRAFFTDWNVKKYEERR